MEYNLDFLHILVNTKQFNVITAQLVMCFSFRVLIRVNKYNKVLPISIITADRSNSKIMSRNSLKTIQFTLIGRSI